MPNIALLDAKMGIIEQDVWYKAILQERPLPITIILFSRTDPFMFCVCPKGKS
jgi:hypothetical protein